MEIRKRYVSPKTIANSYDMSVKTIYKYFDIMKQIFR